MSLPKNWLGIEKTNKLQYTGWKTSWPRYTTRIRWGGMSYFQRFWVEEPLHSETIWNRQKTVYLNTSIVPRVVIYFIFFKIVLGLDLFQGFVAHGGNVGQGCANECLRCYVIRVRDIDPLVPLGAQKILRTCLQPLKTQKTFPFFFLNNFIILCTENYQKPVLRGTFRFFFFFLICSSFCARKISKIRFEGDVQLFFSNIFTILWTENTKNLFWEGRSVSFMEKFHHSVHGKYQKPRFEGDVQFLKYSHLSCARKISNTRVEGGSFSRKYFMSGRRWSSCCCCRCCWTLPDGQKHTTKKKQK